MNWPLTNRIALTAVWIALGAFNMHWEQYYWLAFCAFAAGFNFRLISEHLQ
jgi:hypothetical protein